MSENNKANSITEGVIWKQLLIFFFPILFGTLFQSLYNTVDAVIVGQALGKEALAAVSGGTSTMINLIIGFFTGISSGATVMLSQAYGQGDEAKIRKCLHTATAIGVSSGLLVSVLGYIFTVPLLNLISTPPEILPLATRYLHVYFLGATSIVMYNMGAGIFRAVGDSRSPLHFLILGSLMNIVMDILFIVILKRGVSGAAEATVLSQVFSCIITYAVLAKRKDVCRLEVEHILSFNACTSRSGVDHIPWVRIHL